jgi:uncharacterized membrane protein YsdA (DUF1294 family)
MSAIEWYLIVLCGVTFFITVFDKMKAIHGGYRVPEKTLFLLAFLGGSAGLWLGMVTVRHKTRKPVFFIGVPLIALAQTGLYIWLKSNFIA